MKNKIKLISVSALGVALVYIFTRFFSFSYAGNQGYIHLGDSMIYLFATLLPLPYSIFAASIGAALADLTLAPQYTVPTIFIKAAMAVWFTNKFKASSYRNLVALMPSTLILIAGYFAFDYFYMGDAKAFYAVGFTAVQGIANALMFIVLSIILSKSKAYTSLKEELQ